MHLIHRVPPVPLLLAREIGAPASTRTRLPPPGSGTSEQAENPQFSATFQPRADRNDGTSLKAQSDQNRLSIMLAAKRVGARSRPRKTGVGQGEIRRKAGASARQAAPARLAIIGTKPLKDSANKIC
jgi:hypothetical protein